jgi:transcriptional antiterminator NusG
LDQNEQAEVVETGQEAAAEDAAEAVDSPQDSPAEGVAEPAADEPITTVDQDDGLGALMRAVEQAEAEDAAEAADAAEGEDVAEAADVDEAEASAEAEGAAEAEVDAEAAVEEVAEVEAVAKAAAPAPPVEDDGMRWYVIHTYSGYERKVKQSLEERVRTLGLEDQVAELLIPTEDVVEMKSGRKVVTAKKFFPGYLLIRMDMNEDLWHVVKNTPRVTGFVGSGRKPIPLPQDEVDKIVNRMEESVEAPKPKFQFRKSETVRIIDGPFTNFTGKVEEVDARRSTLKVMVSIFGRNTPVELDFFQVEKV